MTPLPAVPEPHLNRALPGWATDAIRVGIPAQDASDRRKVWTMCMKIAMSAHRRGWSQTEYSTEIAGSNHGGLWQQLTVRPDGRRRSAASGYKALWKAWDVGAANVSKTGVRTKQEIAVEAANLANRWANRITEGADGLSETEAAVMGYVLTETERRGYLRVACPGRAAAEFAKVSHASAARVLATLTKRGLLVKHSAGRRGTGSARRAAIYGLVDPDALGT
jgi:hypothetical protein